MCVFNEIKDLENGVLLYYSGLAYMLRFGVKSGDKSERGFQRGLIKNYPGWAEGFHPSFGSTTGIPDVMFLYDRHMLPVELKTGEIVENRLIVKAVRPAQIRWAKKFRKAGGTSAFLCGVVEAEKWSSILLPFDQVIELRQHRRVSAGEPRCLREAAPDPVTSKGEIMIFHVQCYKGPNKQAGYEDVEAESAQEAAEKVCGEPLTDRGPRWKLRAKVLPNPQASGRLPYYAKN